MRETYLALGAGGATIDAFSGVATQSQIVFKHIEHDAELAENQDLRGEKSMKAKD